MSPVVLFLLQAMFLVVVPFAIRSIPFVRRILPLVVLQILLGIALGPTVLERVSPGTATLAVPPGSLERLSGLSWLAVMVFTFVAALHLDLQEFAHKSRSFFAIGLSSMITPFIAGVGVGFWALGRFPGLMGPKADAITFVVALGVCVSTTALPVLAALLRETGLITQPLGRQAMGYAALNDLLLWMVIIALLTVLGGSHDGIETFIASTLSSVLYIGLMAFGVRPLIGRAFHRARQNGSGPHDRETILACVTLFGSALITEMLGLHYLIGAFIAGVVMPAEVKASIAARFESMTVVILLPFYFIVTGLKVTIDVGSADAIFFFSVVSLVAAGSKIIGTAVPARLSGQTWPDALYLGALMQSKGLMEVVVLTVLLDADLISSAVFSALVLMALVTTTLTLPLAHGMSRVAARITSAAMPPAASFSSEIRR